MHSVTVVPSAANAVFYPIGNTPATNLLNYHTPTPDNDAPTEILLLACGDLRSILYSLYCEGPPDKPLGVQNSKSGREKFNFTCCDLEPTVLARNVLLFSLMIDYAESYNVSPLKYSDAKISTVWNLCYHIYVPQQDLEVLHSQASKLLQLFETAENWANGLYGSLIKVVSLQTAGELRNVWRQRAEVKAIYDKFYAPGPKQGCDYTFFLGPYGFEGLDISNHALFGYWRIGVAAGNDYDVQALGNGGLRRLNPIFSISSVSEKLLAHFHSNPFAGFHLAQLFDVHVKNTEAVVKSMAEMAKTQFMHWSKAFVNYAKSDSVLINVYYGDAVTFCNELAGRDPLNNITSPITRCYTTQWSIKSLAFDGDGVKALPKSFDVIDTSNIAD